MKSAISLAVVCLATAAMCAEVPAELAGTWKVISTLEKDSFSLICFKPERVLWRDTRTAAARAWYSPAKVVFKDWSRWRSFVYSVRDNKLSLQEGETKYELEKLATTPPELDVSPLKLGMRTKLSADELAGIKAEFKRRMVLDQKIRTDPKTTPEEFKHVDNDNFKYVRELVLDVGWIDCGRFGLDASHAAFLIVQHSFDLRLMQAALPEIEKDVKQQASLGQGFGLLYDRTMLALGHTQRYGSQLGESTDGKPVVPSLEDPDNVNQRRKDVGMPEAFEEYALGFMSDYGGVRPLLQVDALNDATLQPGVVKLVPLPTRDESLFPQYAERKKSAVNLDDIVLPANPTAEQVEQYIDKVLSVKPTNAWRYDTDEQVSKLTALGAARLETLLKNFKKDPFYVGVAVKLLATNADKPLILKYFKAGEHDLIGTIISRQWTADVKDYLIAEFKKQPGKPAPYYWLDALLKLNDPETYDVVQEMFINSTAPHRYLEALSKLKRIDLAKIVRDNWGPRAGRTRHSDLSWAIVAAQYGHADALPILLNEASHEYYGEEAVQTFTKLTGQSGKPADLKAWLDKHGKKLKFDAQKELYALTE